MDKEKTGSNPNPDPNRSMIDAEEKWASFYNESGDQQKSEIDAVQAALEAMGKRGDEEDFSYETNINRASKVNKKHESLDDMKERSFKAMDVYSIQKGENAKKFGERTRRRNDMTVLVDYIQRHDNENTEAYSKRVEKIHAIYPRQEGENLEQYRERIKALFDGGEFSEKAEEFAKEAEDERRAQRAKHLEELRGKKEEFRKKRAESQSLKELDSKLELTREKRRMLEDLKKADELLRKEQEEKEKELEGLSENEGPLVAINADFTHDKQELAHDYAERQLNTDVAASGIIKRIWKGNLFKKYYEKKYEREIMAGKREVIAEDGSKKTLDDIIKERSSSAIARFTFAATEEYGKAYIHDKAGESMSEADKHTTEIVKSAIEKFATAKIPEGGNIEDIVREFKNDINELKAEAKDNGSPLNETLIDNYLFVAKQARMSAEHGIAMDRVMDGFKVYNADVRNNVRTEVHRDNIDKIVNKVESTKLFSFVPPEILAAAVGTATALTQTGARAVAGAVGGIGLSGVFAGLRERNRVTEDRARKMRDVTIGLEYNSGDSNTAAKKRAKYEANLGGTFYRTLPAKELTDRLNEALESKNPNTIMSAIAEARVRIDYSDSEQKDLIAYTSADALGSERTALDVALISAEHNLPEERQQELQLMKERIQKEIDEHVSEQDRAFRKLRTVQALKHAGKTIAIGSAFFLGSQEIMAAIDPNKIGILEKAGILKTKNNEDVATETLLARLTGPNVHENKITLRADQETEIQRLKQDGYTAIPNQSAHPETKTSWAEVSPADAKNAIKVNTTFADNGTKFADGNELGLHLENGQYVAKMAGNSTVGGQVLNYEQLAANGAIKAQINIGGATFDIGNGTVNSAGQFVWPISADGKITTATGDVIKAFGDNGEKLFKTVRVVVDNGVDANGVNQVVALATDVGRDSFSGTISEAVETVLETPATIDFVKKTISGITYAGATLPLASRTGLGEARRFQDSTTPQTDQPTNQTAGQDSGAAPAAEEVPAIEEAPATDEASTANEAPAADDASIDTGAAPATDETPTTASETTTTADYDASTRNAFISRVGENGIRFMTSDENSNRLLANEMIAWLNSLADNTKNDVVNYMKAHADQAHGRALREIINTPELLTSNNRY